ncbi:MAG: efflux RND transporter periplasmic adaptor subunit [Akkermansiaceae bacterium]|nr:efflux RND transporter periplasmic adaptor subunit [Akkermansiaceae bacterium]
MKTSSLLLAGLGSFAIATFNTSCQKSEAAASAAAEAIAENGAQFKKGEGLSLTDEMQAAIGLKIEDVSEEKVGSSVTLQLTATGANLATGWISPAQAASLKLGMEVRIEGSTVPLAGTITKIDPAPIGAGDAEVSVSTKQSLAPGTALTAVAACLEGEAAPAIPGSALLRTAEGTFVYTVNGKFYVRTPVTVGASNDRLVEIKDGLYAGDQVVTTPVMSLWMAELQVLRGGKACTCGH